MVYVYALLCAANLLRSDCTTETAIDVISMPNAANELVCLQGGQMTLGSLAIQPQTGEYWKVICTRHRADLPSLAKSRELPIANAPQVLTSPDSDFTDRN
jgi:hypothetical protein